MNDYIQIPMTTTLFDEHNRRNQINSEQASALFIKTKEDCMKHFETWNEIDQTDFVEFLLSKMSHCQHSQINQYLKPMLQRDFISLLPSRNINMIPL